MTVRADILCLFCLFWPVCLACQRPKIVRRPGEPDVVFVSSDDSTMGHAIVAARNSTGPFIARLAHPSPSQSYAGIKVPVTEGDTVEYLWMSQLSFDGTRFRGVLGNDPIGIHRVKRGDTLDVL